jgi:hypothetical protein
VSQNKSNHKECQKVQTKSGDMVHDFALGRDGIVIGGSWVEVETESLQSHPTTTPWEWLVLYDGGELLGADSNDLIAPVEIGLAVTPFGEQL